MLYNKKNITQGVSINTRNYLRSHCFYLIPICKISVRVEVSKIEVKYLFPFNIDIVSMKFSKVIIKMIKKKLRINAIKKSDPLHY